MIQIGEKIWAIAEGYIPSWSTGPKPQLESHATACFLNTSDEEATIEITIFYKDKEPVGPYKFTVEARRTKHVRFNDLKNPEPIPVDTDFASLIISSVPVVVQHTRLDSRQAANTIMTTIAYSQKT